MGGVKMYLAGASGALVRAERSIRGTLTKTRTGQHLIDASRAALGAAPENTCEALGRGSNRVVLQTLTSEQRC